MYGISFFIVVGKNYNFDLNKMFVVYFDNMGGVVYV